MSDAFFTKRPGDREDDEQVFLPELPDTILTTQDPASPTADPILDPDNPFGGELIQDASVETTDDNPFGGVEVIKEPGTFTGLAAGVSRGTAQVLGLTQDVVKLFTDSYDWGLRELGSKATIDLPSGTESVVSTFEKLGVGLSTREFQDLPPDAEKAARFGSIFSASTVTAFFPIAKGAQALTGAQQLARAQPATTTFGAVRKAGENIIETARRDPRGFLAVETVAAAGAAQGDFLARLKHPGSEVAGAFGQIAGGVFNPAGMVFSIVKNMGLKGFRVGTSFFTQAGRERLAAEHLQRILIAGGEDPATVARLLTKPADIAGIPNMTTGLTSGSPALLQLENSLATHSSKFAGFKEQQMKATFKFLRETIDNLGNSQDPAALKLAAEMRLTYFDELLSGRIAVAQAEAADALARIPVTPSKAEASSAVRDAIHSSLVEARAVEKAFWDAIPLDIPVPNPQGLSTSVKSVQTRLLVEDKLPFEKTIRSILNPEELTTTGELINLRSRLLTEARDLRGQNRYGPASIMDELAEGVLVDLSALEIPVAREARDFSRMLNDTFSRTFAGKILRVDSVGGSRISPELTLERAFGTGGTEANIKFRDLQEAGQFGDLSINASSRITGAPVPIGQALGAEVMNAQERFLGTMAQKTVVKGVVDPDKLAKFLSDNDELLQRFPELRESLQNAGTATKALQDVMEASAIASKTNVGKIVFSKVVGSEDTVGVIKSVMNGKNPDRDLVTLARMAKKHDAVNASGAARDGLRTSVLGWAMNSSRTTAGLDFRQLQKTLYNPTSKGQRSPMQILKMGGAVSNTQAELLDQVIKRGVEIQDAMLTGRGLDELTPPPDAMFDLMIRVLGARTGAKLGQGTGGGSLVIAGSTVRFARNMFEKLPAARVTQVLEEAMRNQKFAALLLKKGATPRQMQEINSQINGFLIDAGLISREEADETQ